jgi:hypothetical protein
MQIVHSQTSRQHHQHTHVHEGGEPTSHRVAHEFKSDGVGGPSKAVLVDISARAQARRCCGGDAHLSGFGDHTLHPHHTLTSVASSSLSQSPSGIVACRVLVPREIHQRQDNVYYFFEGDKVSMCMP